MFLKIGCFKDNDMIRKAMNSDSIIGGSRIKHLVAFGLLVACCSFVVISVISDSAKADSTVEANAVSAVEKESKPARKDKVRRVDYKLTSKTKKVPFSTQKVKSPDYYEGESFILRDGTQGESKELYIVKLVDGKAKNRTYVSTTIKKEPVSKIVAHGTKKRIIEKGSIAQSGFSSKTAISQIPAAVEIALDKNGKPINYKQKIVGPATAYCGGGTTSRGKAAMPGRVAVDPKEIPYGSKLYIVSSDGKYIYGYSEAWDTGGFIHTSSTVVDLYFGSYNDCVKFGRRSVEIYVIE